MSAAGAPEPPLGELHGEGGFVAPPQAAEGAPGELEALRRELAAAREELEARRHVGVELESELERLHGELAPWQSQDGVPEPVRQEPTAELEALRRDLAAVERERDELSRRLAEEARAATERTAELVAQLAAREPSCAPAAGPYLVFATVGGAYELIESAGALPAAGGIVEVLGQPHHVLRLGPSPLAGSALPCVYTIPAASSPTGDSPGSDCRETAAHGNQG